MLPEFFDNYKTAVPDQQELEQTKYSNNQSRESKVCNAKIQTRLMHHQKDPTMTQTITPSTPLPISSRDHPEFKRPQELLQAEEPPQMWSLQPWGRPWACLRTCPCCLPSACCRRRSSLALYHCCLLASCPSLACYPCRPSQVPCPCCLPCHHCHRHC